VGCSSDTQTSGAQRDGDPYRKGQSRKRQSFAKEVLTASLLVGGITWAAVPQIQCRRRQRRRGSERLSNPASTIGTAMRLAPLATGALRAKPAQAATCAQPRCQPPPRPLARAQRAAGQPAAAWDDATRTKVGQFSQPLLPHLRDTKLSFGLGRAKLVLLRSPRVENSQSQRAGTNPDQSMPGGSASAFPSRSVSSPRWRSAACAALMRLRPVTSAACGVIFMAMPLGPSSETQLAVAPSGQAPLPPARFSSV
jgi:hypothetical protein